MCAKLQGYLSYCLCDPTSWSTSERSDVSPGKKVAPCREVDLVD